MLTLILINVPCLENVVNFEKGSNSQNHSSSDSHNPIKIFFIATFAIAFTWNGKNKIIKTSFWKQNHFQKILDNSSWVLLSSNLTCVLHNYFGLHKKILEEESDR